MTTAETVTLADFLLARFVEEAADAREMAGLDADGLLDPAWRDVDGYAVSSRMERVARRVLAECEAKRRIVEGYTLRAEQGQEDGGEVFGYHATGMLLALRLLASVYADHPDYRDEWRP